MPEAFYPLLPTLSGRLSERVYDLLWWAAVWLRDDGIGRKGRWGCFNTGRLAPEFRGLEKRGGMTGMDYD